MVMITHSLITAPSTARSGVCRGRRSQLRALKVNREYASQDQSAESATGGN